MDSVHDLGGRQGFGRIQWEDEIVYEPFHADWEKRMWSIALQLFGQWRGQPEVATLDWFRHVRERIDPIDYLTRPYFDQWAQSMLAILIDSGLMTLEEVTGISCHAAPAAERASAQAPGGDSDAPSFQIGDAVRTVSLIASDHTRLPGYARGRTGRIHSYHGPQVLADASARGDIRREPLYTVVFAAADLWPEAAERRDDKVYVDVWESYLEAA